ncbi:hypothetical protein SLEP1_g13333 [Rubroshorea leprosula]|uniref:CLAVATA3/ESR (CLE)-related protein 45 n=1 Tax=Rubroshorea leprosula TaxID=152421 RepID=A0AAV5IL79_9ROSI|nr:hypothetical protein SLEP1_g13333 [Rubroshorea leprosula]
MVCSVRRVLILLICIWLLTVEPNQVSGLRSKDLVFRHRHKGNGISPQNQRILKAVDMEGMSTQRKSAPVNNKFDPNQSSKRKVRRGSDPIHNRS